jgi:hypothetical protein
MARRFSRDDLQRVVDRLNRNTGNQLMFELDSNNRRRSLVSAAMGHRTISPLLKPAALWDWLQAFGDGIEWSERVKVPVFVALHFPSGTVKVCGSKASAVAYIEGRGCEIREVTEVNKKEGKPNRWQVEVVGDINGWVIEEQIPE